MMRPRMIIIGGGTMGLSTANEMRHKVSVETVVIDQSDAIAPSRDASKIMRIDYANKQRTDAMIQCAMLWHHGPELKGLSVPTGRVVIYHPDSERTLDDIDATRTSLKMSPRTRYDASILTKYFGSKQVDDDMVCLHNEDDSTLDYAAAMGTIKQLCEDDDITVLKERVEFLKKGDDGLIRSVSTVSGTEYDATDAEIVLAAGAWTKGLLIKSKIGIGQSRMPKTTGLFSFTLQLSDEQWQRYRSGPILSEIGVAEFICHPTLPNSAKITWVSTFSIDSEPFDASKSDLAILYAIQAFDWARTRIPNLIGAELKEIHSWWDGMTDDQSPVIARHPECVNLTVATGGSYTHAKDLPVIGQKISRVAFSEETLENCGWSKSSTAIKPLQPALVAEDRLFERLLAEAAKDHRVQQWKDKGPNATYHI